VAKICNASGLTYLTQVCELIVVIDKIELNYSTIIITHSVLRCASNCYTALPL